MPDQTTVLDGFPEGIVRPLAFEIPDRLTDVTSWHGHIPFAFWIVEAARPRVFVELGTHKGDSYCAFAQAVAQLSLDTACYAVDTWQGDEHAGLYGEEVFENLRRYHEPRYGRFSRLIRSTFDDAAGYFDEGSVDLLHIDGLHTYEAVAHDFARWRDKLSSRAVVLFHDINVRESQFGVWRLWNEVSRNFPSFAFRHSHGLGVLAVGAEVTDPLKRLTRYDDAKASQVRVFFSRLGETLLARAEAAAQLAAVEGNRREQVRKLGLEIDHLRARDRRVIADGKWLRTENADLVREITNQRIDNTSLRQDVAHLRVDNTALRQDVAYLRADNTALRQYNSNLGVENGALHREIATLEAEYHRLSGIIESQQKDISELQWRTQIYLGDQDRLLEEAHRLWDSTSWRLFRPLRNLIRNLRGYGPETETIPTSSAEALQTILTIRQSFSWELLAPLRIVQRIFSREHGSNASQSETPSQVAPSAQEFVAAEEVAPINEAVADLEIHKIAAGDSVAAEEAASIEEVVDAVGKQKIAADESAQQLTPLTPWDRLIALGSGSPRRNAAPGSPRKPSILFASHEATRTGAPLILLSLVAHFAQSGNYELYVFCDRAGPLVEAFSEYARVIDCARHDLFGDSPTIHDLIEACSDDRPILAICNTSLVNRYAAVFKRHRIPVITLVHEMSEQNENGSFTEIYQTSDRVVFPAEFVRLAVHKTAIVSELKEVVIPQGLLDPGLAEGNHDVARRSVLQELNLTEDAFLVLGCGSMILRKGIDLFVELAQKVVGLDEKASIHFVWLGANGGDVAHWMNHDIAAHGLARVMHLVGEREKPAEFFKAANAFVLTSREDPFPCVVLEAMASEMPVVAFDGVGGAPEALEDGCGIVVPYGNTNAMAKAVIGLHKDRSASKLIGKRARARVLEKYRFEEYYAAIKRLAADELGVPLLSGDEGPLAQRTVSLNGASLNSNSEKEDFHLIQQDSDFDLDFFLPPAAARLTRDDGIRLFIRECTANGGGRKAFSGFNHQVYAELAMSPEQRGKRNPLAHFIENAKPQGPWMIPLLRETNPAPGATGLDIAIHIHAYYPDLIDEFLQCMARNVSRCDLFVTTTRQKDLDDLSRSLAGYDRGVVTISVIPNRGRDVRPFVTEYEWLSGKYDLIGHLHCKKTPQYSAEVGRTWRQFLWQNLVGGDYPMMDLIARHFEDDSALGLAFPDDPHLVGWTCNEAGAARLANKMGLPTDFPEAFEFPVGTMFWCRPLALKPLFELTLSLDDYPLEPLPIDGTILHAIERLLPFIAQHQGYRIAATHIAGVGR